MPGSVTEMGGGDEAVNVPDVTPEEIPSPLFSGRTIKDVKTILDSAKLDKGDLQSVSQEILFDASFSTKEYRLVQLDKDVLDQLEVGQILVFRGDENDAAVLCTDNETYEIKEVETSNSIMIFEDLMMPDVDVKATVGSPSSSLSKSPDGSANDSGNSSGLNDSVDQDDGQNLTVKPSMILDVARSYLETKKIRPNLSRIHFILSRSLYNDEPTASDDSDDVTLETLLEVVPGSKQEIVNYLEKIRVVDIEGKLRRVDDNYLFKIFSQLLNCVDANSWSSTEIDKQVVAEALSPFAKPFFIEKVFKWFLEPYTAGDGPSTSRIKYTYQENMVCRFLGEVLLKSMGKFNLNEFLKIWQESVPEGLKVNLKQLSGVAAYDEESSPPVIQHFPEYSLPETLRERLSKLFQTKKRWQFDEIVPFLDVFSTAAQSVGVLLTKYARSTSVNGVKYFSSKYGK